MSWLLDPFEPEFMQRALLAGVLASLACSVVGTWVVLRGLAFLGDALAHGVIPGMALAVLWDVGLVLGAAASAAVMIAGVSLVGRRARLRDDTGIGLLFVGMLALGVILVSTRPTFGADVSSLLFGDVLAVTVDDLRLQAVAVAVIVLACIAGYRPFLALAFNPAKAASLRLRPGAAHVALLVLVTAAIVASFQAVGTLLVFGLLVGPPATASLLVRRVWVTMAVAALLGALAVVVGLALSYHWGTAAGATIAATSVAGFFLVLAGHEVLGLVRRPTLAPS